MPRTDILDRKTDIEQWISENRSKAFICRELHCKAETLERYLKLMNINYAGNKGNKGHRGITPDYKPASEYIKGECVSSHRLKLKLLKEGLKEHKCEKCGQTTWLGQPIPLELHHINGNHYDNNFDNLQLLCPNCHALEDNNSGAANKKN